MRLFARLLCILVVVGCNEVSTPTTAPVSFTVPTYDWKQDEWVEPLLEGVQICQTDTTNCVETDRDGKARPLWLPIDQEISCTLEKKDYGPTLYVNVVPAEGLDQRVGLIPDESLTEFFDELMSRYPMVGTGLIAVYLDERFAGATFELVDATGQRQYYQTEQANPSLDLTATTSEGWGGFVEVSPGEHRIRLGGTAQRCSVVWGWPAEENSLRIPVREGYISLANANCPLP